MADAKSGSVVLDTDVYSVAFTRRGTQSAQKSAVLEALRGRDAVIAFQTRAEVLAGGLAAGWGGVRLARLQAQFDDTATIWADSHVTEVFAGLTADCRAAGHPLHQKAHAADRWIAACAIANGLSLLSFDHIFDGAPDLDRVTVDS